MFDWAEYLELAREMVGQGEPSGTNMEARLRCAASRAYYAAFGRARMYLSQVIGVRDIPDTGKVHEFVISRYRENDDRRWKAIGSGLDRLRQYRNDADYHEHVGKWDKKAQSSLKWGRRALGGLSKLEGAPW